MNKFLLVLLVVLLLTIGTASALWVEDGSIVNGLVIGGPVSEPGIYNDSGTWKLISGETVEGGDGLFYGFQWNGTAWVSNSSIVTGISTPLSQPSTAIYIDNGTTKMIYGLQDGTFHGFQWNGTSWVSNSSIVTGLSDVGLGASPTVYNDSGTWKLISGSNMGTFYGFQWNGTAWVSNSSIVTGLSDLVWWSSPNVYNDSGTWKLISGNSYGLFYGFQWNGTSWVSDSGIVSGLTDVGTYSTPFIYNDSGTWKLISGEETNGNFNGWYLNSTPITSSLQTESQTNPTQIYTNISTPYFNWTYSDADDDTQYSWEIQVGTASGLSDMWNSGQLLGTDINDVYAGSTVTRNVTYYVQVRTNDSYENSSWATGTFKINTLPVVNGISITPGAPADNDDLTANNDTATDGDGDATTVYYKWYKDDVLQTTLNDIVTINSSNTTEGEVWKIGVIPNDGYENGTEVFSATVTIGAGNHAPTMTDITTNVSTKKYGYSILVTTIDAFDQDNDNYTLHVGSSTGASDICNSSSTTNGTEASCSFIINWTSGSHTLYGRLTDGNDTSGEETVIITVDVTPPALGVNSVNPAFITTDETTTVTASITVANGTVSWVKVKIRNPNLVSTNYTMTGVNNTWTYTFSPGPAGNYLVTNFYASDDSGNEMSEAVSLTYEVQTGSVGGGTGGAEPNVTVLGDLTLTPDRRDTYFFYTAVSGERSATYKFIANRNLETCRVEPNTHATCEIIDGYIVLVTLTVNETVKTYDGTLTVTDDLDYTASSILIVRVVKLWGALSIPEINVGPLAELLNIFFETSENTLIGIRTYVLLIIGGFFGLAVVKSFKH